MTPGPGKTLKEATATKRRHLYTHKRNLEVADLVREKLGQSMKHRQFRAVRALKNGSRR
jgi:hypothetical protein